MWLDAVDRLGRGAHGISEEKALKAWVKVSVLVSMLAPRPSMATAPRGSGLVMMPTMVPMNTASRCHAWRVTPTGGGMNQISAAMPTEMPRFFMLAPHLKLGSTGAAADAATTAVAFACTCTHTGTRA